MLNSELKKYIEVNILPKYEEFDKGHNINHVEKVITNCLEISKQFDVNANMVYTIAAYHDLGLKHGRENHHNDSARIIIEDLNLKNWFNDEQIAIMAVAASEHRASNPTKPTTIYGLIISEGDRDIDYNTILTRTIQYSLKNFPSYTKEEHYDRVLNHIIAKYGDEGYLNLWIETDLNVSKLNELRSKIKNEQLIQQDFDEVYCKEVIG